MIKNYDESVEINHNPNWPYTPDHPYGILIIGCLGSGKTKNLIRRQGFIQIKVSIVYKLTRKSKD